MIYRNEFLVAGNSTLLESNFFEEIDKWKTSNQNHSIQKFKSTAISEEDYVKIKSNLDIMKTAEDYSEYKKAFDRFCYFCHIVPRGVILKKYELKKGDKDHNSLYVEYSYNCKKITLPEDVNLYHMTKVDGITELLPFFRGKAVKGFMYDKPRIYFTIRKHMPRFLADYRSPIPEKLHMYICKEDIKQVYVDPLVWANFYGAVYIESNRPVKVEQITKDSAFIKALKRKQAVDESTEIDFDNFYHFVTENGLTICEEK